MKIAVISTGMRTPSSTGLLADRVTDALLRALPQRPEIARIEVREHAHAAVDAAMTGFPGLELAAALEQVTAADALVMVTPIYQASYAGLFKAFVDLIPEGALKGAPVLLAATGGTERHSLAIDHSLRPLVAYLGGVSVPTGVFAATSDFGAPELDGRIHVAARQLATLLGGETVRTRPKDGFADVTPFEELLGRIRPE